MRSRIGIGVSLLAFVGTVWGLTSAWAMGDSSECEASCEAAHRACVEVCQSHQNPVECDGRCQDELHDCRRSCR